MATRTEYDYDLLITYEMNRVLQLPITHRQEWRAKANEMPNEKLKTKSAWIINKVLIIMIIMVRSSQDDVPY